MDDLISRYVSIEYVCAMMMRKGFRSKEMTISEFMDILKPSDVVSREAYEKVKLKSAQPEIIRCKDCKWSEPVSGYLLCGAWEAKAVDKDDFCSDAERREDG